MIRKNDSLPGKNVISREKVTFFPGCKGPPFEAGKKELSFFPLNSGLQLIKLWYEKKICFVYSTAFGRHTDGPCSRQNHFVLCKKLENPRLFVIISTWERYANLKSIHFNLAVFSRLAGGSCIGLIIQPHLSTSNATTPRQSWKHCQIEMDRL